MASHDRTRTALELHLAIPALMEGRDVEDSFFPPRDAVRDECASCGRAKFAATICSCDDSMLLDQLDAHPIETIGTLMAPSTTGQDAWYRFGAERSTQDDELRAA